MLDGPAGERHWDYWRQRLTGELSALNLPIDRPRPAVRESCGESLELPLDSRLARALRERARAEGVTLFTLMLAAFQTLLHRYSAQNDFLVGAPAAGGGRPEFQRVAGDFVNMVVLRADLSGNPPFRELLGQVRRTVLEALQHQDFPFPLLA